MNANIVGRLRGVPVVTYMGISPVEYFRCRRERRADRPGRPPWLKAIIRGCGRSTDGGAALPGDGAVPARQAARMVPASEIGL